MGPRGATVSIHSHGRRGWQCAEVSRTGGQRVSSMEPNPHRPAEEFSVQN